jgi:hypothetical protein
LLSPVVLGCLALPAPLHSLRHRLQRAQANSLGEAVPTSPSRHSRVVRAGLGQEPRSRAGPGRGAKVKGRSSGVVVCLVDEVAVVRVVGRRFRWLRRFHLGMVVFMVALGVGVGNWWVVLAAIGLFGFWLSELKIGIEARGDVIVVQNLVQRYEIERDEVDYVDGVVRWSRSGPGLVLRSGRTITLHAFNGIRWNPGYEVKDARRLARALDLQYRAG